MLPAGSLLAKKECERPQKRAQPLHSTHSSHLLSAHPASGSALPKALPSPLHTQQGTNLGITAPRSSAPCFPPLQAVNTWLSNSRWELKQLPPPCPSQGCLERLTISWEIQLFPLMSLEIPVLRCSCSSGRGGPEPLLIIPGGF